MTGMHEQHKFLKQLDSRETTSINFSVNLGISQLTELLEANGFSITRGTESLPCFQKDVFSGSSDDPFPFKLEVQTLTNYSDGTLYLRIIIENPAGRSSSQDDSQERENIIRNEFEGYLNFEGDFLSGSRLYGGDMIENHFAESPALPCLALFIDYPDLRTEAQKERDTKTFELESLADRLGYEFAWLFILNPSADPENLINGFCEAIIAKDMDELNKKENEMEKEVFVVLSSQDARQFREICLKKLEKRQTERRKG